VGCRTGSVTSPCFRETPPRGWHRDVVVAAQGAKSPSLALEVSSSEFSFTSFTKSAPRGWRRAAVPALASSSVVDFPLWPKTRRWP